MLKRIAVALVMICAALPAAAMTAVPTALPAVESTTLTNVKKVASNKLIGSSQAARIARGVAPQDKLLGVRLSQGSSPRYVVKTKGNGRVREIVIDAHTGAVLRR